MIDQTIANPVRRGPGRPPKITAVEAPGPIAPSTPAPISADELPVARSARKPFGTRVQKLAYAEREGYHRHWFNDVNDRLLQAQEAGYEYVKDNASGRNVCRPVGVSQTGAALMAYLMEIPASFYEEDQAAKQAVPDQVEQAIRRGDVEGKVGVDGRYVPSQGIKVGRGR